MEERNEGLEESNEKVAERANALGFRNERIVGDVLLRVTLVSAAVFDKALGNAPPGRHFAGR